MILHWQNYYIYYTSLKLVCYTVLFYKLHAQSVGVKYKSPFAPIIESLCVKYQALKTNHFTYLAMSAYSTALISGKITLIFTPAADMKKTRLEF